MALLMSVGFAVPVFYLCQMQGSFIVFWLAWLISLSDGIGESTLLGMSHVSSPMELSVNISHHHDVCDSHGHSSRKFRESRMRICAAYPLLDDGLSITRILP